MSIRLPLVLLPIACSLLSADSGDRIQLTLDTSEADQVLAILALRGQGQPVPDAEWGKLIATEPYRRLQLREKTVGLKLRDAAAAFTDDDFRRFVLSEDLLRRRAVLSSVIDRWKKADLRSDAERILVYLPAEATVHAKICPVIKPRTDSFIWDISSDPVVFLNLEPGMKLEKFENNVAHELYHIGLASLGPVYSGKLAGLPAAAHAAAEWMASFSEGTAMLAAAGGPTVDPHAASSAKERARWTHDLAEFNNDLPAVNEFFQGVLNGQFPTSDALQQKGRSFYGIQGPWFTVGYKMSAMVERRFGRPALVGAMLDPRCLLVLYNRAATERNSAGRPPLPLWSDDVLAGVRAGSCGLP
jgi:hypothetical protein